MHKVPALPGLEGKESKAQDLQEDQPLLALPTDPARQECLPSWSLSHWASQGKTGHREHCLPFP